MSRITLTAAVILTTMTILVIREASILAFGKTHLTLAEIFSWQQSLLILQTVSHGILAVGYISLGSFIEHIYSSRKDVPFSWIYHVFSAIFILSGIEEALFTISFWYSLHWLHGYTSLLTAMVVTGGAVAFLIVMSGIKNLPTIDDIHDTEIKAGQLIEEMTSMNLKLDMFKKIIEDKDAAIFRRDRTIEDLIGELKFRKREKTDHGREGPQ